MRRQVTSLADNHYRYACSDCESSGVVDSVARGCWRAAIPGAPSTGVGAKVSMTRLVGAVMSPGQVAGSPALLEVAGSHPRGAVNRARHQLRLAWTRCLYQRVLA